MSTDSLRLTQVLIILIALASKACAFKIILYEFNEETEDLFFTNITYLIIYGFLWNFLIEISLIVILHFKQTAAYVANHSFINICIVIFQLVNNLVMDKNFGYNNPFFIVEAILFAMEMIQITLGNFLNNKLRSEQLVKKIFILRFLHRYSGRVIYLLRKYQLISYAYLYLKYQGMEFPGIAIAPIIIITVLTHISAYVILRKSVFVERSPKIVYLIQSGSEKRDIYLELLKNIENGDLDQNSSGSSIIDLESNMGAELIKTKIKWVIIEDKVYDITDLRHPKGNYILKGIEGKDITREIHGSKAYRFESRNKKFSKLLKHKHVPRTLQHLLKSCIGPISISPLIVSVDNTTDTNKEDSAMTLQISNMMKLGDSKDLLSKESYWQSDSLYKISDYGSIMYTQKLEKDFLVNISVYWLYTFGRYFVVTFDNGVKDFMYALLSFSPIYIHKKFEFYSKLKSELTNEIKLPSSVLHKDLKDLYTVMLQGLDRNQRQALESSNEVRSCHLPLYWQSNKNSEKLKAASFSLLGPVGLGLGFDGNCTLKVLIIVKDEGILPLIDFFEFLSQRALIELTGQTHPIFTDEYLYAYSNNPEFSLYWDISEDYWPTAELIALNSLHTLNITYRRDSTNKVKKLVKLITISSILSVSQNNIVLTVANVKRDFTDITRLTNGGFEKYIVSGPDSFVKDILATRTVPPQNITVL